MSDLEMVAQGADGTVVLMGPFGSGAVVNPDGQFFTVRSVDSALVQSDWLPALGPLPGFVPVKRVLDSITELLGQQR